MPESDAHSRVEAIVGMISPRNWGRQRCIFVQIDNGRCRLLRLLMRRVRRWRRLGWGRRHFWLRRRQRRACCSSLWLGGAWPRWCLPCRHGNPEQGRYAQAKTDKRPTFNLVHANGIKDIARSGKHLGREPPGFGCFDAALDRRSLGIDWVRSPALA